MTVPALNMGGWYDLFLGGTLANYVGMKQRGGSAVARAHQRLVIGPWSHINQTGAFPERSYGLMASSDVVDLDGDAIALARSLAQRAGQWGGAGQN